MLRPGYLLRLWRPSRGSWGDAVVLAICQSEDEREASELAKCSICAGTVLVQYVDMTSWKMLTPEDIVRWSHRDFNQYAVIDDFSSLTFTEQLRALIGLRKRSRIALGSHSVADGMESSSVRDNVRERGEVPGVGGLDCQGDAQAMGTKKLKFTPTIEQLITLVQPSALAARWSKSCTEIFMPKESLCAAMVSCSHADMSEEFNMQSDAQKSTVAARTDAADRDAARVSTKANVTEEGTAGRNPSYCCG